MRSNLLWINWPKSSAACLIGMAALLLILQPSAWAEQSEKNVTHHAEFEPVTQLSVSGYSAVGPIPVVSFDGKTLVLYTGRKQNMVFDLTGKTLTVKDSESNTIPSSSIVPEAEVYVCFKNQDIIVFVMPKREKPANS